MTLLAVALLTCLAVAASSAAGDVRAAQDMGRRAGRTKV